MADLPMGAIPLNTDVPLAPTAPQTALPQGAIPLTIARQQSVVPEEAAPASQSLVGDIQERWAGREQEVKQTATDFAAGLLRPDQAFIQVLGKGVAGPFVDATGAVMSSGFGNLVGLLPDSVTGLTKEAANSAWDWATNTVAGEQALLYAKQGTDAYAQWKSANPQDAKTLESIVNIGAIMPSPKNAAPSRLGRWADRLDSSAQNGRKDFVEALVLPERTKKVRMDEATRTEQKGPLFRNKVQPSPLELDAIEEVSKLPVTSLRSPQYNYNLIRDHNRKLANQLEASLDAANIPVDPAAVAARMDTDIQALIQNSAVITGNVEQVANKVKDYAMTLFQGSNGTAADLLRTRRQFDQWVAQQKGGAAFDAERLNALTLAVRQVRGTLNSILDAAAPNQRVRDSLRQQSNLYYAMDNIQEKAANEAATVVGRLIQNIHRSTGGSLPSTPLALGATATAVGGLALSGWMPYAVVPLASGVVAASVYAGATSPLLRQNLGRLLRDVDSAMKNTANANMKVELAKDRLALMELFKSLPVQEKEE